MNQKDEAKLKSYLQQDFESMDSKTASQSIQKTLDLINALQWESDRVDPNVYDDLTNRYCDHDSSIERLKLLANVNDQDAFTLSIIDQLKDYIDDHPAVNQLYAITLDHNERPLNDTELQDLVKQHALSIRPVNGLDAKRVAHQLKLMVRDAHI
ncbi:hypothetical protein [Nicoliella lavandulae]|uniref:Uncharacterized protein n=1 Tax=Nicoliella lavandulae TaxID=3082954 RepID=A0ABU8SMQ3_9LACO